MQIPQAEFGFAKRHAGVRIDLLRCALTLNILVSAVLGQGAVTPMVHQSKPESLVEIGTQAPGDQPAIGAVSLSERVR
jgi:hypothetical protein